MCVKSLTLRAAGCIEASETGALGDLVLCHVPCHFDLVAFLLRVREHVQVIAAEQYAK